VREATGRGRDFLQDFGFVGNWIKSQNTQSQIFTSVSKENLVPNFSKIRKEKKRKEKRFFHIPQEQPIFLAWSKKKLWSCCFDFMSSKGWEWN
jgi:hypothetical protein